MAPRVGVAYDVSGDQRMVLRGAVGLYFDRPDGNTNYQTILNPPIAGSLTQQWGDLRALNNSSLKFGPVPNLRTNEYDSLLPSDIQWNAGVQRVLPWASSMDVAYVGHHQPTAIQLVNFNNLDLGTSLDPKNFDTTNTTAGTPLPNNLLRPIRGYGDIQINQWRFKRDFHSVQINLQRNFRDGFSFGVTDTWTLSDTGTVGLPDGALRLSHNADGSWQRRADQAQYEELFKDQGTTAHQMTLNFTYDLPDAHPTNAIMKGVAAVTNDWQLSGIMSVDSGELLHASVQLPERPDGAGADRVELLHRAADVLGSGGLRVGLLEQPVSAARQHDRLVGAGDGQQPVRIDEHDGAAESAATAWNPAGTS